jgi:hypothetical protein
VLRNRETVWDPQNWHFSLGPACRAGFWLALVTASLACQQATATSDVSDSTFVASMTELRLVAMDTSLDSARRERKRDSVLRAYRLTPAKLESAASRLGERPEHAVELLHAIDTRVATGNRPRPVPPPPKAVAPAAPVAKPHT